MQMVERPWGVASYGAASVRSIPDLARIRFRITRLQQTPSQAFESAGHAVRAVRDSLRRHSVPDAAVDRSRLLLTSAWSGYGADRKFLGFQCQAGFGVESRNLDGLESLVVDLVAAGANEIEGIDFDVIAKRELRAQARREAVAAARDKAQLYAEAAGVTLGPVIHIDDVDPEQLGQERYRGHFAAGEASSGDLSPGHVVVSAAVVLGFSITHG
jgi:uncharacterized protein